MNNNTPHNKIMICNKRAGDYTANFYYAAFLYISDTPHNMRTVFKDDICQLFCTIFLYFNYRLRGSYIFRYLYINLVCVCL